MPSRGRSLPAPRRADERHHGALARRAGERPRRRGDHRGTQLGFPTANVAADGAVEVPEGVYAGLVHLADGRCQAAAVSVGTRETFNGSDAPLLVEAHLLDFSGDLYGESSSPSCFWRAFRGQLAFGSVAELVEAIRADIEAVRSFLDGPAAVFLNAPSPG